MKTQLSQALNKASVYGSRLKKALENRMGYLIKYMPKAGTVSNPYTDVVSTNFSLSPVVRPETSDATLQMKTVQSACTTSQKSLRTTESLLEIRATTDLSHFEAGLGALHKELYDPFIMHMEGYRTREIALYLNMSESDVCVNIAQVRHLLQHGGHEPAN